MKKLSSKDKVHQITIGDSTYLGRVKVTGHKLLCETTMLPPFYHSIGKTAETEIECIDAYFTFLGATVNRWNTKRLAGELKKVHERHCERQRIRRNYDKWLVQKEKVEKGNLPA